MSQTDAYRITALFDKMDNTDHDIRYMGLNGLLSELQKEHPYMLEDEIGEKICKAFVKRLDDKNNAVRDLAVTCVEPLVKKITKKQVLMLISILSTLIKQEEKKDLREVAFVSLKIVIKHVDTNFGQDVCKETVAVLLPMLNNTLHGAQSDTLDVQRDALDILNDTVSRFGDQVPDEQHSPIIQALLQLLDSSRPTIRKQAGNAIGNFAKHINESLFRTLWSRLIMELGRANSSEKLWTFVHCTKALSQSARLGEYIPQLLPCIKTFATSIETSEANSEDIDLCEESLSTLGSIVLTFPKESAEFIDEIISISLNLLKYNPNLANSEDEDQDMDNEDEDSDNEDADAYYSDDDGELSYKVRCAATKLITDVIEMRPDLLQRLHKDVAPVLISRFKEPEAVVRANIMKTFVALLQQTNNYCNDGQNDAPNSVIYGLAAIDTDKEITMRLQTTQEIESCERVRQLLRDQVPELSRALAKELATISTQARKPLYDLPEIGFLLLHELVKALHGGLDNEIDLFMPVIETLLNSSNSEQQQQVLTFLCLFLHSHSPKVLQPYLARLCPSVLRVISETKSPKVVSEAFQVCLELIKVIRPVWRKDKEGEYEFSPMDEVYKPYINGIFEATLATLSVATVDQEVKKRSIICLGRLLAQTGDILHSEQHKAWRTLLERLQNEVTRLVALRTLAGVSQSPIVERKELEDCVNKSFPHIINFLKMSDRQLRITSLECMAVFMKGFGSTIPQDRLRELLFGLKPLMSDADLFVLTLALQTAEMVIVVDANLVETIKEAILPDVFKLTQSPLLQGAALGALVQFVAMLAKASPEIYQFLVEELVKPFLSQPTATTLTTDMFAVENTQAASTVAQCIGVLAQNTSASNIQDTVQRFQGYIKDESKDGPVTYISLLILGEIGCRIDLSQSEDIVNRIVSKFSSTQEQVKLAAASALGNISVGNNEKYLPMIIQQNKEHPERRLLLLHSLKKIITSNRAKLDSTSDIIWSLLVEASEQELEKDTRIVVAECLGKLALTDPAKYLPKLELCLTSSSPSGRATASTAVKYPIASVSPEYDALLEPIMAKTVQLLKVDYPIPAPKGSEAESDPNNHPLLDIHRLVLLTIDSALQRKPYLMKDQLDEFLPLLYDETEKKEELVQKISMGSFIHEVDYRIDIRKAAFECMQTLQEKFKDRINVHDFLDRIQKGLDDKDDEIKMRAYLTLKHLCVMSPTVVAQRLDNIVDPLKKTIDGKAKSPGKDKERGQTVIRATLQCIAVLTRLDKKGSDSKFDRFVKEVGSGALGEEFKSAMSREYSSHEF